VVRQAHSANWWLPDRGRWRLRYLHGGWAAETRLAETTLGPGKVVLESRRGTTSHQLNPWFTLDPDGSAAEESGEVWSGELAWSGSWKLVYEVTSAGRVHACGGWNDFDWAAPLAPGAELVLPSFAGLHTTEGFGGASREWHAWQRAHVLGCRPVEVPRWPDPTGRSGQPPGDAVRPVDRAGDGEPGQ
jgi:alpha-galactosidase